MNIEDFKNKHEGERVFIVGNGPSLKEAPLDKLENEFTIAMNKINLIYSSVSWRPSYFVYVRGSTPTKDRIRNCMETVDLGVPSFISQDNSTYFPERENIMYINRDNDLTQEAYEFESVEEVIGKAWSNDISEIVCRPGSSMYVAAQIASYMRFDELIFVGCDGYSEQQPTIVCPSGNNPNDYDGTLSDYFKFIFENRKPVQSLANGLAHEISKTRFSKLLNLIGLEDTNHFDTNYTIDNISIEKARRRNENLIKMHNAIEKIGDNLGFETYNATINKNIDIHEPVNFTEIIDEAKSG